MYDLRRGHNLVFRMYSYSGDETVSMSISDGLSYPLVARRGCEVWRAARIVQIEMTRHQFTGIQGMFLHGLMVPVGEREWPCVNRMGATEPLRVFDRTNA